MDPFEILKCFFDENKYFTTNHHIESYNDFVTKFIPLTIKSMNPFTVLKPITKHEIKIWIGGRDSKAIRFTRPVIMNADESVMRSLSPNEARLKNITYQAQLFVDIDIEYFSKGQLQKRVTMIDINIANIPIMLHSRLCRLSTYDAETTMEAGECQYDVGGYFIVDGKEKVVIAQERETPNKLFVRPSTKEMYAYQARIVCKPDQTSVFPKTHSFYVYESSSRKNAITVKIPQIGSDYEIPIVLLFRALGIESDRDILSHVANEHEEHIKDFFRASLLDCNMIYTQQQALLFLQPMVIYSSDINSVVHALMQNVMPHVANYEDRPKHLGQLINELIKSCLSLAPLANRDHYENKRVEVTGALMSTIFKDFYNEFRKNTRSTVDHSYEQLTNVSMGDDLSDLVIPQHFKFETLKIGLVKSLKSNWGLVEKKFIGQDPTDGVVQDLSRISYMGFLSHLRMVALPMDTSIKIREPHQLNGTHWGYMCPCETPDGPSVGIIKNLAMMCHVTFDVNSTFVHEILALPHFGIIAVKHASLSDLMTHTNVMVNNIMYGVIPDNPHELVTYIRLLRRNTLINIFTSISWDILARNICIFTEGGRVSRPLLIVENNKVLLRKETTWDSMIAGNASHFDKYSDTFDDKSSLEAEGFERVAERLRKKSTSIEFIDATETPNCLIATTENDLLDPLKHYTHMEIHPSTILGLYVSTIPFANHNAGPRNIFASAQGKQAIGVYATNFVNRIDTMSYVLHHAQRPLISTKYSQFLNTDKLANGENLIVAIASYTGYNQEDSVMINQDAIERGMFNITCYKSHVAAEDHSGQQAICFANPLKLHKEGKHVTPVPHVGDFATLDSDGLPIVNQQLTEGDAILGKCLEMASSNRLADDISVNDDINRFNAIPLIADKTVSGTVDKVVVFVKNDEKSVKIRLRKVKMPELGDKLASRHSQKGVIGMVVKAESMPFTADGLVPDIIINPHAIPSRMTIAHLLECLLSKCVAVGGRDYDGTSFQDDPQENENMFDILESRGLHRHGDEIMYNGMTGEQIQTEVFIGPTYYYRLKHMVSDKQNYRRTGRVMQLTKQPTQGRGNDGGNRAGEMEVNALLAHGISGFIKETFVDRADGKVAGKDHSVYISKTDGYAVTSCNPEVQEISKNTMPYAFKLFSQELATMCIGMKYNVNGNQQEENDGEDLCSSDDEHL